MKVINIGGNSRPINWHAVPFVRLLLPFMVGIIGAIIYPQHNLFGIDSPFLPFIFFLFLLLFQTFGRDYSRGWVIGVALNAILVFMGYQLTTIKNQLNSPSHFSHFNEQTNYSVVRIIQPIRIKEKSVKIIAQVNLLRINNDWKEVKGKVLLYMEPDERSLSLKYGNILVLKKKFKSITFPKNPGEFNYQQYLSHQNIFHQVYMTSDEWLNTGSNRANLFLKGCYDLKNYFLEQLKKVGIEGDEYTVGSAMLLGNTDELDADIRSKYSIAGVMHVLCVSGLHLGVIYLVLNSLLAFLERYNNGKLLKAIWILSILWVYAGITGFSPSVTRAATMFSFMVLANVIGRKNMVYNTLAASAFLLLLIDPYLFVNVGFQLSYIAVLGILYLYPKLYHLSVFENKVTRFVWSSVCVSVAAQLAVAPLLLYYFHTFSTLFLMANLMVIPLAVWVIYSGMLLLLVVKVPLLSSVLAKVFKIGLVVLNYVVNNIANSPYSVVEGVYVSIVETILMYAVILFMVFYATKRNRAYFLFALSLLCILASLQLVEMIEQHLQKKIIVYSDTNVQAIHFISGKEGLLLLNGYDEAKQRRHLQDVIENNRKRLGILQSQIVQENIQTQHLLIKEEFIQFCDKRILYLTRPVVTFKQDSTAPLGLDYLIVSKGCRASSFLKILQMYQPHLFVFDASFNDSQLHAWKQECEKINQPYYSVSDSGAFVVDLSLKR